MFVTGKNLFINVYSWFYISKNTFLKDKLRYNLYIFGFKVNSRVCTCFIEPYVDWSNQQIEKS